MTVNIVSGDVVLSATCTRQSIAEGDATSDVCLKLTDIFPTEAAGSSRPVGMQVSVSEIALLVDPQAPLVIVHDVLPILTVGPHEGKYT